MPASSDPKRTFHVTSEPCCRQLLGLFVGWLHSKEEHCVKQFKLHRDRKAFALADCGTVDCPICICLDHATHRTQHPSDDFDQFAFHFRYCRPCSRYCSACL